MKFLLMFDLVALVDEHILLGEINIDTYENLLFCGINRDGGQIIIIIIIIFIIIIIIIKIK